VYVDLDTGLGEGRTPAVGVPDQRRAGDGDGAEEARVGTRWVAVGVARNTFKF
jgi:hypothetical protein